MLSLLEIIIQSFSVNMKRLSIIATIIVAITCGSYLDYTYIFQKYGKFEYVIFIGNLLTILLILIFSILQEKYSRIKYTKTYYITQVLIVFGLLTNFSTSNNNDYYSINIIINIFIWYSFLLNNTEKNLANINTNSRKEIIKIVSIIFMLIYIINQNKIQEYSTLYLISYSFQVIIVAFNIYKYQDNQDKIELNLFILYEILFFCSYQIGSVLNASTLNNKFINDMFIFILLVTMAYRINLKLTTEFYKIHDISINLAKKMGELSLMHIEAQKSEKAKENFLAIMSHEIRTPVNGIIGHAELLSQTDINEEQQKLLSMITISSNNLMKLINEILDLPNLISGQIILSKEIIDISSLVESVIDVVSPKSFEKGIELTYFIEPSVPLEIIGDQKRIGQILLNLCNNALKFTEIGEVFIGVTQIDETDKNHVELLFEVKDTGIGIATSKIKMLFKAYSQTDASISRKFGGTGLGLAISAQLIDLMKGKIWVESIVGKGTRFLFTLNCEIPAKLKKSKIEIKDFQGVKCLAISENPTMRYILGRRFRQWKMPAKIISKFEEAQHIIGIEEFRILIVDIVSDSKKATMFLKANQINPTGKIPSIALISLGKNASPDLQLIANETITKPLKTETLAKTILKLINNRENNQNIRHTIQPQNISHEGIINNSITIDNAKKFNILVAEDNPVNQKLIMNVLNKIGFNTKLVENGKLAVEEEEKNKYDIILMDLQMPEMDGFKATRNIILNSAKRTRPKIIALTANAMPGDKEKCLDAGMDDYIAKPIQFQLLSEKLFYWLDKTKLNKEFTPENNSINENKSEKNKVDSVKKIKILVAEDNPINQKLIMTILTKLGYTATLVENGALAYEACKNQKFDIIIMDLQMPVMNGLDASQKIKSDNSINPKPIIIALTANAMSGDREKCLNAGMDDYMTKPVQIKLLDENIKKWGTKTS